MNNANKEIRGNFLQKKITDYFIFCKPKFDYNKIYEQKDQLIFIQKEMNNTSSNNYIPCMFHRNPNSRNFLICFHGNSEDIFSIEKYSLNFRSYLNMNIIFVEYPGYSIYIDQNSESDKIFSDSIIVYEEIKKKFNLSDDQIFIFGRSLGTSTAIYLASIKTKAKALFLVSAFTSIKGIGEDNYVSFIFEKIFNSIKYIKNVECPILFIHGKKDPLISFQHSINLSSEAKNNGRCNIADVVIRDNMTHNDFDIVDDIVVPINNFLNEYNLNLNGNSINNIDIDKNALNDLHKVPISIQRIIESKTFNIKEFSISNNENKIQKKINANILIRLIDKRFALSHGLKITLYIDRHYTEDYTIDLYQGKNNDGTINCLCQLKNENLICSTTRGDIFMYKIDDEDYENKKYISLNDDIIYKIEVLNSNEICLLSEKYIKIYDNDFNEKISCNNSHNYNNFVETDDCFAFLSDKYLRFCEIDKNEKQLKFNNSISFKKQINKIDTYNIAKVFESLIIGYGNIIGYIDRKKNEIKETECNLSMDENIIFIHKIHELLFLASTDKGSILQIIINENNNIEIIKNSFVNGSIKSLLFKNINNILFIFDDKINILNNSKKEQYCRIY